MSGDRRSDLLFRISLAEWSLHRAIQGGRLDHLDFAAAARGFGIEGVEYVSTLFGAPPDPPYLGEMQRRASEEGVTSLLIMVDAEGALGDPDAAARDQAVQNHSRWIDAAAFLGCHAIRVNALSRGSREEQQMLVADGMRALCEIGEDRGIDVLIENHGGYSSDGAWLAGVMRRIDHPRAGTLPDFGNFSGVPDGVGGTLTYDRYQGVEELMPWVRAVSAKSHSFDERGNEGATDYSRMLGIVLSAGYRGWIGIEYEGEALPEPDGIRATKALLERVRLELGPPPYDERASAR